MEHGLKANFVALINVLSQMTVIKTSLIHGNASLENATSRNMKMDVSIKIKWFTVLTEDWIMVILSVCVQRGLGGSHTANSNINISQSLWQCQSIEKSFCLWHPLSLEKAKSCEMKLFPLP